MVFCELCERGGGAAGGGRGAAVKGWVPQRNEDSCGRGLRAAQRFPCLALLCLPSWFSSLVITFMKKCIPLNFSLSAFKSI